MLPFLSLTHKKLSDKFWGNKVLGTLTLNLNPSTLTPTSSQELKQLNEHVENLISDLEMVRAVLEEKVITLQCAEEHKLAQVSLLAGCDIFLLAAFNQEGAGWWVGFILKTRAHM